jgi:channel protein (hemolysin III family)
VVAASCDGQHDHFHAPADGNQMDQIEAAPIPGFREPVNCFTHLLAAIAFSILSIDFVGRGRGNWSRTASLAVMAFSSVFLLSMSAVYHSLGTGVGRALMRQLDIAAVYVLIAGTMTPVHAILDTGVTRWTSLLVIWLAAATGITLTTVFAASLPTSVIVGIFLLFGWGGVISLIRLWRKYGFPFVAPLIGGGLAYTLGAIALELHWPRVIPRVIGAHEVWHLAVVAGLGLHWRFVYQFAHGAPATTRPRPAASVETMQGQRIA